MCTWFYCRIKRPAVSWHFLIQTMDVLVQNISTYNAYVALKLKITSTILTLLVLSTACQMSIGGEGFTFFLDDRRRC